MWLIPVTHTSQAKQLQHHAGGDALHSLTSMSTAAGQLHALWLIPVTHTTQAKQLQHHAGGDALHSLTSVSTAAGQMHALWPIPVAHTTQAKQLQHHAGGDALHIMAHVFKTSVPNRCRLHTKMGDVLEIAEQLGAGLEEQLLQVCGCLCVGVGVKV